MRAEEMMDGGIHSESPQPDSRPPEPTVTGYASSVEWQFYRMSGVSCCLAVKAGAGARGELNRFEFVVDAIAKFEDVSGSPCGLLPVFIEHFPDSVGYTAARAN